MFYILLCMIIWSLVMFGYRSESKIVEALSKLIANSVATFIISTLTITQLSFVFGGKELTPFFLGFYGGCLLTGLVAIGTLTYCIMKESKNV